MTRLGMQDHARQREWPERERDIQHRIKAAQPQLKRRANPRIRGAHRSSYRGAPMDPTPLIAVSFVVGVLGLATVALVVVWADFLQAIGLLR